MGSESPTAAADLKLITSEELSKHNVESDLWIAIQGKVYDVTGWLSHHPGGEIPLLDLAGQDVTDAFIAYHPSTAWRHLDRFLVGRLSDYRVSDVSRDYRRLLAEFSKAGLFDIKGHGVAFSLTFIMFFFSAAVYGVVCCQNPVVHLLSGAILGFVWIQLSYIGHDAGHYNVMTSPRFNRLVQICAGNCFTGISIGWWKSSHNAHHIACNSLDYDPDVQHIPVFAVSPSIFSSLNSHYYQRTMVFDRVAKILVSWQHWTFYPVMCLARINLYAQSIMLVLFNKKVPNRWQEIVGSVLFWVWFPLLVSCLPNWGERVMFVMVSFAVTGIQHVQFCLNHFSSTVYVGKPRGNDWFEKQIAGTLDIACSPWMDWFHGGLQFQVEHHLFPRLPRCHLRKISPLVKQLCKKHNLTYNSASFWKANVLTIRTLREAALQARNLVWEAVNTHG